MPSQDRLYKQKSREQRQYYNSTAQQYDEWHTEPASAKIVDQWNFDQLKAFLGDKKPKNCLDLGSGTGRLANSLMSLAQAVYGVDQSEKVLEISRKKYPRLNLTRAEVIDLPYSDSFFDMVIINGSLHHFFAVEETLAEANRVLRSGGVFVLLGEPSSEFMKIYNPFFYIWILNRIINKIHNLFRTVKPIPSELIEPDAESYRPTRLKVKLAEADFLIEKIYTYDYFARSESALVLKFYYKYLNIEHKTLARVFPRMGTAIQAFCYKK